MKAGGGRRRERERETERERDRERERVGRIENEKNLRKKSRRRRRGGARDRTTSPRAGKRKRQLFLTHTESGARLASPVSPSLPLFLCPIFFLEVSPPPLFFFEKREKRNLNGRSLSFVSNPLYSPRIKKNTVALRQLSRVGDDDLLRGRPGAAAVRLDLPDDVHAVGDAAEDDVLPVEPRGLDGAEEELLLFWFLSTEGAVDIGGDFNEKKMWRNGRGRVR